MINHIQILFPLTIIVISIVILYHYTVNKHLQNRINRLEKFKHKAEHSLAPIYIANRPPTKDDFNGVKVGCAWIDEKDKQAYLLVAVHAEWVKTSNPGDEVNKHIKPKE